MTPTEYRQRLLERIEEELDRVDADIFELILIREYLVDYISIL